VGVGRDGETWDQGYREAGVWRCGGGEGGGGAGFLGKFYGSTVMFKCGRKQSGEGVMRWNDANERVTRRAAE
jgi:hypothetical protein